MTIVSNAPSWWPTIDSNHFASYFVVASSTVVVYDSVLTFGQEVDLLWRQRWSLVTFLYLSVRYIGILYSADMVVESLPTVFLSDMGCIIVSQLQIWATVVVNAVLCIIMITRLHVMYHRSRKILIFLIVIFLAVTIASTVIIIILTRRASAEEVILSGTYQCTFAGYNSPLSAYTWILGTTWEVLALCLAAWIAVKHFRALRRESTGRVISDCLTVLMQSHLFYFGGFALASSLCLGVGLSPALSSSPPFVGILHIATFLQMFVLGPRLVLSIRENHAKLVVDTYAGTGISTMSFKERAPVSTGSDV